MRRIFQEGPRAHTYSTCEPHAGAKGSSYSKEGKLKVWWFPLPGFILIILNSERMDRHCSSFISRQQTGLGELTWGSKRKEDNMKLWAAWMICDSAPCYLYYARRLKTSHVEQFRMESLKYKRRVQGTHHSLARDYFQCRSSERLHAGLCWQSLPSKWARRCCARACRYTNTKRHTHTHKNE